MRYILILAAVGVLAWLAHVAIWPFRSCRRCDGSGKRQAPRGRAWRDCPRCGGTGARLRPARRLWNLARRLHRHGTR